MTEASWGEASKTPEIDWAMSAALENVVREGDDIPEVTNLKRAVEEWARLDPGHQLAAVLTPERPIMIDGAQFSHFEGEGIRVLVECLPS